MSTPHEATHGHTGTGEHAHPGPRYYVVVAVILAIITAAEVAIYDAMEGWALLNVSLGLLSAAKFLMVIGVYMHLKFDNRLFSYMFGFGLVLAASIITALWFLFWQYPLPPQVPGAGAAH